MQITQPSPTELQRRIALDFPFDEAAVRAQLAVEVTELTDAEFDRWQPDLESTLIDGQRRYFARAVSNLFRINTEAARRRNIVPSSPGQMDSINPRHSEILAAARRDAPYRHRLHATHTVTVVADAVPAGTELRLWLPVPQSIPGHQDNVVIDGGSVEVAAPTELQRTALLTAPAVPGEPTRFALSWQVDLTAQCLFEKQGLFSKPPQQRLAMRPGDVPAHQTLAEDPPHIVFSPAVREFARSVLGFGPDTHHDPIETARALYAAVDAIPWAGAREYGTVNCIPDYVLTHQHGDCGMQTLLLISLLRLNGIPARWESGWVFVDSQHDNPSYNNLHDWGWLRLPDHGWIPFDVTTGALDSDVPELANFYFGNLDPHRVAFNSDIGGQFSPAKRHPRSDPVDNQRGEVEWEGGNLYYDQWSYDVATSVEPMEAPPA